MKNFEEAHKYFDRATSIDRNNSTILEKKYMAYFVQREDEKALETINKVIEINPNVGKYWAQKASLLAVIGGENNEIDACASKAFELAPHDTDVKFHIQQAQQFKKLRSKNKPENKSEGCFIATAAYGSPIIHEIDILRKFRDEKMLNNVIGEGFVNSYYKISPMIAKFVAKSELLKVAVRSILKPLIYLISYSFEHKPK